MPLGGTWTEQARPGLLLAVPLPLIWLDLLGSALIKSLYVAHRQTNSTAKETKSSRRNLANFTHDSQSLRLAQVRLAGYPSRTSRVPDASTCRYVWRQSQAPKEPETGCRSPLCTSRKLIRFFFNQFKRTVSDSEDTGHRDTKPIGGLFAKVDRSEDDSEAGHRTVFEESPSIGDVPSATGWARITKPDTQRRR